MGKDTKNYYEAYNDASDLDGDGALDVGYKPDKIDYYGYFDSRKCYAYDRSANLFVPTSVTADKRCVGAGADDKWSGNFLNYLTMSRTDADIAAMRTVKAAFDPTGYLNPAVLFR